MTVALEIVTELNVEFYPALTHIFTFLKSLPLASSTLDKVYRAFVQRLSGKNVQLTCKK